MRERGVAAVTINVEERGERRGEMVATEDGSVCGW